MPSTNGHAPKRAILYARVSTEEQAKSGYSLASRWRLCASTRTVRGTRSWNRF
jgi:DNA invertase Pin-like site-specific DNA recombinase